MGDAYATFLLLIYMLIYVSPFYLFASTRPSPMRSRDAIPVMQARTRSVIVSCCICSAATMILLTSNNENSSVLKSVHQMGYFPLGITEVWKSLLLTSILFAGPLFERGFIESGWKEWINWRHFKESISTWIGWRNYVVGPVTEEILFRSASIPIILLSRMISTPRLILQPPLIFGLAHLHHFYEFRIMYPHAPESAALMQSLLQLGYTTAFGAYATFLYVRSGSLLSVILVHAFCNWVGIPRFWGKVGEYYIAVNGLVSTRSRSQVVVWTSVYYLILVMGAWGWWKLLWVLTCSSNRLVDF